MIPNQRHEQNMYTCVSMSECAAPIGPQNMELPELILPTFHENPIHT